MAANDQRAPSAPPPTRWSNDSKKNSKEHQQLILGQVREMFESILEPDIILSVVQNCKWKLQPSIDALIMLSETADEPTNRLSRNTVVKNSASLPMNLRTQKNQNTEGFTQPDLKEYKSNLDPDKSTRTAANSFLNLNDKELLRQQEEFRKFELLKKDLTEKGFIPSENENLSKPSYSQENNKIPQPKLQQFGQNWGTKNDASKVYFCSDVESSSNSMNNQLWGNSNLSQRNEPKDSHNQFDNLFGSKLQFSRDMDADKIGNKGTIPKNCKNVDPAIITVRNSTDKTFKMSNTKESRLDSMEYNSRDFNKDFAESLAHESVHQQQVAQFGSNYDNEPKTRAGGGKSNNHKGETESLCGLKVQYRFPGLENSSDDDADVVIEEESTDYPTQIPSLMSINVCQFISSSTQSPPKTTCPEIFLTNTPSPPRSPQRNSYDDKLKNITSSILDGHKVLIILRGLPGSGKTHLANSIVKSTVGGDPNQFIFSTDDYFVMLGRGVYQYVGAKIPDAHSWNQKRVFNVLKEGVSPVIVDNTNTQSFEMQPYVVSGVHNGYRIEVLEPNTPWSRNIKELAKKNTHGIPKERLRKMADRYERNITGAKLIEQFSLRYTAQNVPPQMRKFPYFETNDKQKPSNNKNRNRRRKRNSSANNDNFLNQNSSDTLHHLLSDSDKNMKHNTENSNRSMNLDNTLENIVSNALKLENDTLNKSLVDYCIETDSGDEIDSDKVPEPNRSFDLLEQDIKTTECDVPSSVSSERFETNAESSTNNAPPAVKKIANNLHHQNLGAIGSERKGSVTAIDYDNLERKIDDKEAKTIEKSKENVLSQCWDFTLLVNGRKIHSGYTRRSPIEKSEEKPDEKKSQAKPETEYLEPTGVIITEIFDDEVLITTGEDTETGINTIIGKMDALEQEISSKPNSEDLKPNSEDLIQSSEDLIPSSEDLIPHSEDRVPSSETEKSVGSIGSIFNMIKKSLLGSNSEQENLMKFKHHTNDNSLSENDAFENEKSHREPAADSFLDSFATTVVGDSLSDKLLSQNIDCDKDSCGISKLVSFDTVRNNKDLEFVIDDNLSRKLSDDQKDDFEILEAIENYSQLKSKLDNTKNQCILSNIASDDALINDIEELIDAEDKFNLRDEEINKIVGGGSIKIDKEEVRDDDATESYQFGNENNDSVYDILTEAVNRIISKRETESKAEDLENDLSDDAESQSSLTESSFLISAAGIEVDKPAVAISDHLNEEESKDENVDQEPKEENKTQNNSEIIVQDLPQDGNAECLRSENKSETGPDANESFIPMENVIDDESSIEECCENCCDDLGCCGDVECCEDPIPEHNAIENTILEKFRSNNQALETIDNINQVTWKESPFPVAMDRVISLLESTKNHKQEVIETSEASTNTTIYDFNVLYVGGTSEPEYKILAARNRAINSNTSLPVEEKPLLKLMLDKSSMTSVVNILSGEESLEFKTDDEMNADLDNLIELFPNLPREDITEMYNNCSSNFTWTVDLLLDGVPDHVTTYDKIETPKILAQALESENSTPKKDRIDKLKQQPSTSSESNDSSNEQKFQSPKKKKERNKLSEESLELKRQIEQKMVMNEASYNPHILRVKRWKNGEPDISAEIKDENVGAENDDSEDRGNSPKSSESTDDFTEDDIEPEEMMELNLGEDFIKVLENKFGNPEFQFPDGLFPVIQIKKSMAQQLHALWIESMEFQLNAQQEQLDKMIEKDAEYARSLEAEEARSVSNLQEPNLPEIMDMEMALAIYNNDLKKQIELETPNDMASRLTRQMLHEMFTDNDPQTLDEILKAHNGNFKETVDVLEASTGQVVDRNNTLRKQKSLIDRAQKESIRSNADEMDTRATESSKTVNQENKQFGESDFGPLTYDDAMEEAQASRREAQKQLSLRNENFNKATEAFRKGNREVAGYYSQMAKLHSKKMEWANSTAASAFLAAQDYMMNRENTLDLHYLYVAEALQALDVFLDYQISQLNEGTKKTMNLYIITGRGARSSRGQSRIKPAVSKKLASKNIRFMDENPGCLKVVLHKRSNAAG